MDRTSRPAPQRHAALDVARMLAAGAVVVHHAWNPMGITLGPLRPSLELAVFVFFSLSGFLVFRPFVRGRVAPGDHLVRRMLRIFPAYLVALVATLVLTHPYPAGHELQYALMLQLSDGVRPPGVVSVAWTLHVEVMFYLALPVLSALLARVCGDDHRRRATVIVVLGVGSFLALIASDPWQPAWGARPLMAPLMFWAFVPGMLVAWAVERSPALAGRPAQGRIAALGGGLLLLAMLTPSSVEMQLGPMLAAATGMALMIPRLLAVGSLPRPVGAVAAAGRTLSYPAYLWHITIVVMVAGAGLTGWTGVVVAFGMVLLFSAGSWLFIERPAIGLGDRLIAWQRRRATDHPETSGATSDVAIARGRWPRPA